MNIYDDDNDESNAKTLKKIKNIKMNINFK